MGYVIGESGSGGSATTDASELTSGTLDNARLDTGIDAANLGDGSVSNTEFQYISTLSSNAQTQLNSKASTSHTHTESDITDLDKYTQAEADALLSDKVDVDGAKVLSDNNYTTTEKNKLANIEANADVTDATNVDSAGAVMNSDTSTASMSFVIDEDDMSSNSATKVPTQQSVKAYADSIVDSTFQVRVGNLTRVIGEDGLPPPTITADTTGTYVDYTVSGAAIGYRVHVAVRNPGVSNLIAFGECTGADTVRVYFCTTSGSVAIEEKIMDLLVYKDNS